MACRIFFHLGVSFDVCFLHTHHLGWLVTVLSLNSPPIPVNPGVPPFRALVFVVAPAIALFLAASIPSASPLMEILLPRTRPCNHGLPIEVVLPILFLCLGMCDHDNLSVIPVPTIVPARCVINCALPRTCSWERCNHTGAW
jgi:hypothetical protein